MIKGVIFDMDGVMIDTERQSTEGWIYAAKVLGVEMPMELINSFKGLPPKSSKIIFDEYYKGTIDYDEARNIRTEYIHAIRKNEGVKMKKGLTELLDYIVSNNIACAVATSTQKSSAEKSLKSIGAYDKLNAVVYGDEVEQGKPAPDIFLRAAESIGVAPSNCIVIEDSPHGIKAGFAAGMRVVHIPDTVIITDEVRAMTYKICEDLSQVIEIIDNLNYNQ